MVALGLSKDKEPLYLIIFHTMVIDHIWGKFLRMKYTRNNVIIWDETALFWSLFSLIKMKQTVGWSTKIPGVQSMRLGGTAEQKSGLERDQGEMPPERLCAMLGFYLCALVDWRLTMERIPTCYITVANRISKWLFQNQNDVGDIIDWDCLWHLSVAKQIYYLVVYQILLYLSGLS